MADTINQLIDDWASRSPDKVYLEAAESGKTVTYRELQITCRQINRWLDAKEIPRGSTVAFLLDNGLWTTCLFLGVMYSGRVILPLNAVAGPEQLNHVIAHSGVELILCSEKYSTDYAETLRAHDCQVRLCREDEYPDDLHTSDRTPATPDHVPATGDTVLLIYTSGTTGKPKGVMLSHGNVIAGGRNTVMAHHLAAHDKGLCVLPLYHINAEMVSVLGSLVSNSSLVIAQKFSTSGFWRWMQAYRCTWFSAVPTILSYLIARQENRVPVRNDEGNFHPSDFRKSVRFGRSASAPLAPEIHQKFESLFQVPIIETMGISECAAQTHSNPMEPGRQRHGSVGFPVGNEARIVNRHHRAIPDNEIGELAIKGPNVMKGYFRNPEATEAVLDGEGWFYTGDLGYRDEDGYYHITGRLKELIIRGGENISPREIDDVLYQHPGVLEAAAYGIADRNYGEEVMAAVVLKENARCSEQELSEHCRILLGKAKSPKRIAFLDHLPKGPSGKIQRKKLAHPSPPD
ncbi:MAG: AMP-binding protein [Gammaproteobacteria bacterium]|nr:AMP-binding protein [Gammaproteobacteria bacterium]